CRGAASGPDLCPCPIEHPAGQTRYRRYEQSRAGDPVEARRRIRHGRCAAGVLRHQAELATARLARGVELRRADLAQEGVWHLQDEEGRLPEAVGDAARPARREEGGMRPLQEQAQRILEDHEGADQRGGHRLPQLLLLLNSYLAINRRAWWRRSTSLDAASAIARRRRQRARHREKSRSSSDRHRKG